MLKIGISKLGIVKLGIAKLGIFINSVIFHIKKLYLSFIKLSKSPYSGLYNGIFIKTDNLNLYQSLSILIARI